MISKINKLRYQKHRVLRKNKIPYNPRTRSIELPYNQTLTSPPFAKQKEAIDVLLKLNYQVQYIIPESE